MILGLSLSEHSFAHVGVVCERTAYILEKLGFDEYTVDLALTAVARILADKSGTGGDR